MVSHWTSTGLTALVFFFASAVNGIAGFGLAQVSLGLMPLFRSPSSATTIYTLVGAISHLRVWWSVRHHFQVRAWLLPVMGLALGMPVGIHVFRSLAEAELRHAIGITLLFAVSFLIAVRKIPQLRKTLETTTIRPGWKTAVAAGFVAGLLGGAVAIPGPPMILYASFMVASQTWDSKEMKAILTGFFATLILYRFVSIAFTGAVTRALVGEAFWVIPAQLLGAAVGVAIFDHVRQQTFEWLVLVLLTVNALVLIVTG